MKTLIKEEEYYPFLSLADKTPYPSPTVEITDLEYLRYQQVMKDFEEMQDWLYGLLSEALK